MIRNKGSKIQISRTGELRFSKEGSEIEITGNLFRYKFEKYHFCTAFLSAKSSLIELKAMKDKISFGTEFLWNKKFGSVNK